MASASSFLAGTQIRPELRNDSELCREFIDGKISNISEVVERMCEMKYLYDYCYMEECKDEAYEEYIEEKKYKGYCWFRVSERAEEIALNKYSGGKYPDVFPWLK